LQLKFAGKGEWVPAPRYNDTITIIIIVIVIVIMPVICESDSLTELADGLS